jgi:hypothetical protein
VVINLTEIDTVINRKGTYWFGSPIITKRNKENEISFLNNWWFGIFSR